MNTILQRSLELAPEMSRMRRDLHQYPEVGWEEFRTTSIIVTRLKELGYEVLTGQAVCAPDARMGVPSDETLQSSYNRALTEGADPELLKDMEGGYTGAIAILRNGEGPTVGMRFDIDALPVTETSSPDHFPNREGFVSAHLGSMHACGHDGHITMGLHVAQLMMEMRDQWNGTLKIAFQPAEEGVRGAKALVAAGHLDDVNVMLGSHITDGAEGLGFDYFAGAGGALATTKLDAYIHGLGSHAGSAPEKGHNAIQAMATAVTNLYAIPRHSDGASRINVGAVHAGAGRNIIADEARLEIEIRGATTEINQYMEDAAVRILQSSAAMFQCECDLVKTGEAISLESDPTLMDRVDRVGKDLGLKPATPNRLLSPGSEDYAFMMARVQENGGEATFIRLLAEMPGDGHTVNFDFSEDCLPKGVAVFVGSAIDVMGTTDE